tara:strand:- start:1170 stop:1712 length:543 start_codon:yes stop_codon:yes gene_type:complete
MKIDLFSVPIFIDNIDSTKINLKNKNFEETWSSQTTSSFNFKNTLDEESANYLLRVIVESLSKHFYADRQINLLNVWENQYFENNFQERHKHPHSHFSFIIYKNVEEGRTIFLNPAIDLIESYYPSDVFNQTNFFQLDFQPKCRNNQIVIFPSFLEHMVKKINNSITISGNLKIQTLEDK